MDVNKRLSKGAPVGSGAGEAVPLTRLQRTVARRMSAAKAEVPDFIAEVEIGIDALRSLREERRAEAAPVPSYNDFVVKACALALRRVPKLNASFSEDAIIYHERVNVGVAVADEGSLVVPTIFDADRKSVDEISAEIATLAAKVRDASIRVDELADQTFTVSNLGMHGVGRFQAIVSPPQVGILAVGAIREVVVPDPAGVALRHRMAVVLTSDHRVVYGADAARFLGVLRELLEEPVSLDRRGEMARARS